MPLENLPIDRQIRFIKPAASLTSTSISCGGIVAGVCLLGDNANVAVLVKGKNLDVLETGTWSRGLEGDVEGWMFFPRTARGLSDATAVLSKYGLCACLI